MSYFAFLSLFLLFQTNYGLVGEELFVQNLLDDGSPTDEAPTDIPLNDECATRLETVKGECEEYVNSVTEPTQKPLELQEKWNAACKWESSNANCLRHHLEEKECNSTVVNEYMKTEYKPTAYACYNCRELVYSMDKNYNKTVQQVDNDGNILDGLTCPIKETAECATINAAPLIAKCNSTLDGPFNSDQDHWTAKCDALQCIGESIEAVCGKDKAKEYWQANPPKVDPCFHCSNFVNYMRDYMNISIEQIENETAKCNSTLNGPFNSDQDRWTAKCDALKCIGESIEEVCGKERAKEYWQANPPKVYACSYCSNFVNYMRDYMNMSVQQIENENKTDESKGYTCPATNGGVQNEGCLKNTILVGLIADCGKSYKLNHGLNKDECDTMNKYVPCVGKHIHAICGRVIEQAYWINQDIAEKLPKIYACWYCNDMVVYLDSRSVVVQHKVKAGEVAHGTSISYCPSSDVEREECATEIAKKCTPMGHSRAVADRSLASEIDEAQQECRALLKHVKCIYEDQTLEEICGKEAAVKHINNTLATIDVTLCPYCNKLIDYMENLGLKLHRSDGNGYCERADCENSTLTELINTTCSFMKSSENDELCSEMYNTVLCANETVVTQCGDLFGRDYMIRNYSWPKVYPCWYCQKVTNYMMSRFNKTAQQKDIHEKPLESTCPMIFTSDCPEKNAGSQIEECKKRQIQSNFTLDADPAVSTNVCSAMLESVKCIYNRVDAVCGGAAANETIQNTTFIISERNCPYCDEAINFTEKYGGRLWKESNTSTRQACISQNCTSSELNEQIARLSQCEKPELQTSHTDFCREMFEYATCAYRFAKSVCHEQTAADYMRNGINITVYPCGHCNEVIEYIGKFGGQVYQADKNNNPVVLRSVSLTCPVGLDECYACGTYNARIFVDACKETFYEATSHGHANEKVGAEYCSALHVMLKCVHEEVKAVCGHSAAKTHMQSEYPEAKSDMCEVCNASVKFMDDFGAYVYIRDLPGSAVCKLNKEEEKKPISSAQFYYASSYCIYFIVLALLVHSITV
ncbi:hypothetical protein DdX_17139 [Ditylenchus destructor]|uniref:Uncharacterized protein n=1 Tax=Ditylenchus destructor TaxID=166010 RepID=A0AAD4QZ99_9BILA|nr:hypothetical protein DdX_17139 [Ditylenchus destructor]